MVRRSLRERMNGLLTRRFVRFGIIGVTGTIVNTFFLWLFTTLGMHYVLASIIATEIAIINNFLGNQHYTFKGHRQGSMTRKFLKFQMISLTTLVGTVAILTMLTSLLGERLLLVWNLLAILVMFLANFALNSKYTWKDHGKTAAILLLTMLALTAPASAELVSVGQIGYHPDAYKQIVSYTALGATTFTIKDAATDATVYTGNLTKAQDYSGNFVECQGNNPCLIGVFTEFATPGTYYATTATGRSPEFTISTAAYENALPVFEEFFDAMRQQDSSYHLDYHAGTPGFTAMADGSFIMEANQASQTLIRLGSAYRRNPEALAAFRPYILDYVGILENLQGVQIQQRTDGVGFRLNTHVEPVNVFVPGPTNLTTMQVFLPGGTPLSTVPVVSLCGGLTGTDYDACIAHAATYYKCEADEPCLNMTYQEKTGVITGHSGYAVSQGWGYEFGCFFDSDPGKELFTTTYDPCNVFHNTTNRDQTVKALLAYLESIPAVHDADPAAAQDLFVRAKNTATFIQSSYPAFTVSDTDTGFWGASLFLLYEYTGNETYLVQAHALRSIVSQTFVSDNTRGPEFYWEEYIRNKQNIQDAGLQYKVSGQNPEEFFRGKMFHDYKDMGATSIGKNGERVYQFDNNIQFQNSRFMLTEGLLAAKTLELHAAPEQFITVIADNQLAWVTGMNAVQNGTSFGTNTTSISFIFGIGQNPEQYHSRYLINSGYADTSGDTVIGVRGTGLQWHNGTDYIYYDGVSTILGQTLGASGNGYRNESKTQLWSNDTVFINGRTTIPGWINGAFDVNTPGETDVIFNYRDNRDTYEFTETTNEMVATAIELLAYQDAQRNGRARHVGVLFNETTPANGTLALTTIPGSADVRINGTFVGQSASDGTFSESLVPGSYLLRVEKLGFVSDTRTITILADTQLEVTVTLDPVPLANGTLSITASPSFADVWVDSTFLGTTAANGKLVRSIPPGTYDVLVGKTNHTVYLQEHTITSNATLALDITLSPLNATLNLTSVPSGASVSVDGIAVGTTPYIGPLTPGVTHLVRLTKPGYAANMTLITPVAAQHLDVSLTLASLPVTVTGNGTNVSDAHLFELATGSFWISTAAETDVTWTVTLQNGTTVMSTTVPTSALMSTFLWTPDILTTGDFTDATITATTTAGSLNWTIQVENAINPFFTGTFGAETSVVRVFTNSRWRNYTGVNATVTQDGGVTVTLPLAPVISGEEVDWKETLQAAYGNNNITMIEAVREDGGIDVFHVDPFARVHFRNYPDGGTGGTGGDGGRPSARGGGGGGGGGAAAATGDGPLPSMIYVTLAKDILAPGQEQTVTLDAKAGTNGNITGVQATFMSPTGARRTVELALSNGDETYGTWRATFGNLGVGTHRLLQVDIRDVSGSRIGITIKDRAFAVSEQAIGQEFDVVYSLLDVSTAKVNDTVTLTLDARDVVGIDTVTAYVSSNRGDALAFDLALTNGEATYGTWQGAFTATTGDATYVVDRLTLTREDGTSQDVALEGRSVYIAPLPVEENLITGSVVEQKIDITKEPLLPTMLAFGMMFAVILVVALSKRVRERLTR